MAEAGLAKKFGLSAGTWLAVLNSPAGAQEIVRQACPEAGRIDAELAEPRYDTILFWPHQLEGLAQAFGGLQERIHPDGSIWAMMPKKKYAARRGIDFNWEQMQAAGLLTDMVDNKIASFDDQDYGTRFVIRKERRHAKRLERKAPEMQLKGENPARYLEGKDAPPVIAAYFEMAHLKQLYRQGWLRRGVPPERCESVAEHSFGMAMLALWLGPQVDPSMDLLKAVRMALIHDFGEIYAGDFTPADAVSREEKRRLEADLVDQVFGRLPYGRIYIDLWEEYEAGETVEARFIRQVDRLEMGFQAAVYQNAGMPGMDEFFVSARQALTDPGLLGLLKYLSEK